MRKHLAEMWPFLTAGDAGRSLPISRRRMSWEQCSVWLMVTITAVIFSYTQLLDMSLIIGKYYFSLTWSKRLSAAVLLYVCISEGFGSRGLVGHSTDSTRQLIVPLKTGIRKSQVEQKTYRWLGLLSVAGKGSGGAVINWIERVKNIFGKKGVLKIGKGFEEQF